MKKAFIPQNLRKNPLDPNKNREAVQRDLESWLFLLNVHGREKEFERMAKRNSTSIRKRRR